MINPRELHSRWCGLIEAREEFLLDVQVFYDSLDDEVCIANGDVSVRPHAQPSHCFRHEFLTILKKKP